MTIRDIQAWVRTHGTNPVRKPTARGHLGAAAYPHFSMAEFRQWEREYEAGEAALRAVANAQDDDQDTGE